MTATKERKFPWGKASILLTALIAAVVAYDLKNHGSFEASSTGRFLRRSGVAVYTEKARIASQEFVSASLAAAEARYPQYYKTVVDTCKPYGRLATDFYIVTVKLGAKLRDSVAAYIEKGPIVPASLEPYVSDLIEQVQLRSAQGAEIGKEYLTIIVDKVSQHSSATFKWLEHNVFVGKLSPENLQSYATNAIDTTQTLANQMYDWVCEVVESFSKVRPTV